MPRVVARTVAAVFFAVTTAATFVSAAETWQPELLTREAETRAALEAGPPHFAATAGVYVLTARGYELARSSTNGFHCLVERSFPTAFEPQCFDDEGSRTLLKAVLLRAALRAEGKNPSEVEAEVAAAYADGRLRAPGRPGINYMLSRRNRVPVDPEGQTIIEYRPHLMFFVPYLTNADLGSDGGPSSATFVINEGQPGAYAIVPVPLEGEPHADH